MRGEGRGGVGGSQPMNRIRIAFICPPIHINRESIHRDIMTIGNMAVFETVLNTISKQYNSTRPYSGV
jgi:hypothetical protein